MWYVLGGGWWGRVSSWRQVIPSTRNQATVLCLQYVTETDTILNCTCCAILYAYKYLKHILRMVKIQQFKSWFNTYDWICENRPYWYKNWNLIFSLTWMLHSSTIQTHQAHGYRWPSLLSQTHFAKPVKPWRYITRPVELVNRINEDMCGTKLLLITLSAYPGYIWNNSDACVTMQ